MVQDVWLEQADAAAIKEGEEVTLMDWGNAIIKVIPCRILATCNSIEGQVHVWAACCELHVVMVAVA